MREAELPQEVGGAIDIWQRLKAGYKYIVWAVGFALAVALLAVLLLPQRYEAFAIIQVGQVASSPIEQSVLAVERIKTPSFQLRAAKAMGDDKWLSRLTDSVSGSSKDLVVQVMKSTAAQGAGALIELKASAQSKELAAKKAETVVVELVRIQNEIASPTVSKIRSNLVIAREKLSRAEQEMTSLGKLVASASVKDDRFTQLSLMTSVRLQKEQEIFDLRQSIMALETSLVAPATQSAKMIEAVFVSDKAVSPNKTLLLSLAVIVGLMIGVVLIFSENAWRSGRQL